MTVSFWRKPDRHLLMCQQHMKGYPLDYLWYRPCNWAPQGMAVPGRLDSLVGVVVPLRVGLLSPAAIPLHFSGLLRRIWPFSII